MILYIGNKSKPGYNPTTIDILSEKLSNYVNIKTCSNKDNVFFRLLDMIFNIISNKSKLSSVLIDTYSTRSFYFTFICSQLCRFYNIEYITILHGGLLPNRLRKNKFICRLIFKYAYKIVTPSKYLEKEFSLYGYETIYIPNYVEINNYQYTQRNKNNMRLLYVRAISKVYNPMMLVKAVELLSLKYSNVHIDFVGPDKGDNTLNEMNIYISKKKLEKSITIHGYMDKESWKKLSQECDVFINTTNVDNMPLSLIEAMALGLPIISTNVGGIPFLIKDNYNGLLVNKNDHVELSEAIEKLYLDNVLYLNIINNSRNEVYQYDWGNVVNKWADILDFKVNQ